MDLYLLFLELALIKQLSIVDHHSMQRDWHYTRSYYTVWVKKKKGKKRKGNWDSILNFSPKKIQFFSVDDNIFIFLSLWSIGCSYLDSNGCSAISFVKHVNCQKLSSSKFYHSTQSSADTLIVALLWKLPQMPSCSTNNANLDKTNFDMFYKIDCCAAIHGRIWMNNVPIKVD